MDETLTGTEVLVLEWYAAFRDRYPEQHAQTLRWREEARARAARERDAARSLDGEWLPP